MLVHFSEPFSHKNNVRHCLLSAWFGLTYFQSCCDAKASQQGSCKCLLSDTREREREKTKYCHRSIEEPPRHFSEHVEFTFHVSWFSYFVKVNTTFGCWLWSSKFCTCNNTTSWSLNLFVIHSIYFPSIKKTISVLLFWEDNKFRNQNYYFCFHLNIISPGTHYGTASPTRNMNKLGWKKQGNTGIITAHIVETLVCVQAENFSEIVLDHEGLRKCYVTYVTNGCLLPHGSWNRSFSTKDYYASGTSHNAINIDQQIQCVLLSTVQQISKN